MKKVIFSIFILVILIGITNISYAGGYDYSFSMDYEGDIVVGEEKSATVTLQGVDAPVHTNVRIKIDITGPENPSILATDSNGNEHNIADIGYWGPENGFTVGGTFTNVTPIKAKFSKAGTYNITLTLIDVNNPGTEYAMDTFTINVKEKTTIDEGLTDGDEELGEITELPQTGNYNYIFFIAIPLIIIIGILIYCIKCKDNNK